MRRPSTGGDNRRYCGSGSPRSNHSGGRVAHLMRDEYNRISHAIFLGEVFAPARLSGCRASRHLPVGETEGSLLATSSHESLGREREQYAIAARHCASIEGSAKAGPHTCSCRTMVVCAWTEDGGRGQVGRTNHVCLHNLYEICNAHVSVHGLIPSWFTRALFYCRDILEMYI